jgi:hypothetical protein
LGIQGDWYLDVNNGDVYEKTGSSTYTLRDNIQGPAGAAGAAGAAGDTGPAGPTGPAGATGADGQPRQIQDEGSDLTIRQKLNFVGAGVTATDDSANGRTLITVPGSGHVIQDEGSSLTARTNLNFAGSGVTVADDAANDRSVVTIPSASPTDMRRRMKSGKYYFQNLGGALSNAGWGQNNRMFCSPFDVEVGITIDRLAISVGTVSSPITATVRFGIYADGDGYPDARLVDAGTVDVGTLGIREVTLSHVTTDSLLWLVALVTGATTTVPNAAGWAGSALIPGSYGFQDAPPTGIASLGMAISVNSVTSGLPSTFPASSDGNVTAFGGISTPRIWARVS